MLPNSETIQTCSPVSLIDTPTDGIVERYQNFTTHPLIQNFLRDGGKLTIATERQPLSALHLLQSCGQRAFGEKFLQESTEKIRTLGPTRRNAFEFRFFGCLQSNKIQRITELYDVIETISSRKQAEKIARTLQHSESARLRSVMVQVNLGRESQKNGASPEEGPEVIEACLELGLPLTGLMTIPPFGEPPAPHFRALRQLADRYALPHCQMGFSRDYAIAIDCGSTHIRIGTLIHGKAAKAIA